VKAGMTLRNLQHRKHSRKPTKMLVFETFSQFCCKNVPNQFNFIDVSGFYHISNDATERRFQAQILGQIICTAILGQ